MEYERIDINEINLDLNNPRIKQYIEIYGDKVTSEGIALALNSSGGNSTNSYSVLKESIKVNGGIINPIIVNRYPDGQLVVIEGNTRVQIYKEFAESDPDGPWKSIIAIVYDNLPDYKIHAIRLQTHLVGPRDWDAYSKAKYLHQLSDIDKMPMATIISFCGGKTQEIRKLIDAYVTMEKYYRPMAEKNGIDFNPKDFSKFVEFQNSNIQQAINVHGYSASDFAEWVINENIDTAQNVRKIPQILADQVSKKAFLKENISEALKKSNASVTSAKNLSSFSIDELVKELTSRFRKITMKEVNAYKNDPNYDQRKNNMIDLNEELKEFMDYILGEE